MKITYLYHSGFLVEFSGCYCIFDYFRGEIPKLNPEKPVLVFVSHGHSDHYNPEIFRILREQGAAHITAVLSKDIPEKRWPASHLLPAEHIVKATFHQTYPLPGGVTAQTLHSTDRGVAYLVKCDDYVIYHAGDLNDWSLDETAPDYSLQRNKQMAGSYRHEINLLQEWICGTPLDAAFLPLDPRLGTHYSDGILYFLKKINVKKVYPMHYWDRPEIIGKFLQEHPCYREIFCSLASST